jgi:hypothetical protein
VCGYAAAGQRDRTGRRGGDSASPADDGPPLLPGRAHPHSPRRGLCASALLDFLDAEPNLEYVVAMAKNAVLPRKAEEAMQVVEMF